MEVGEDPEGVRDVKGGDPVDVREIEGEAACVTVCVGDGEGVQDGEVLALIPEIDCEGEADGNEACEALGEAPKVDDEVGLKLGLGVVLLDGEGG